MLYIDIINIIKNYCVPKEQIIISNLCKEYNKLEINDIHKLPTKLIPNLTQNILLHKKFLNLEYINISENILINDLSHLKNLKHITYSNNTKFDVKKFTENKKICSKIFFDNDGECGDELIKMLDYYYRKHKNSLCPYCVFVDFCYPCSS